MRKQTGRGRSKDRFKIRDVFADERCSQVILDFLSSTEVGRWMPVAAEEDAASEVSEWKLGGREEREVELG